MSAIESLPLLSSFLPFRFRSTKNVFYLFHVLAVILAAVDDEIVFVGTLANHFDQKESQSICLLLFHTPKFRLSFFTQFLFFLILNFTRKIAQKPLSGEWISCCLVLSRKNTCDSFLFFRLCLPRSHRVCGQFLWSRENSFFSLNTIWSFSILRHVVRTSHLFDS